METVPILLIVSILHLYISLSEGADEVIVRVCPSRKVDWDAAARRKECNTKGGDYHCVRNQEGKLVESCVPKVWIDPGDCPILYQGVGRFGYERCPAATGFTCPNFRYLSDTVYLYPVCFEKQVDKTTKSAQSTVITPAVTTENNGSDANGGDSKGPRQVWVPIVAVLVVLLVAISIGILFLYWRRRIKHSKGKDQSEMIEEGTNLLPQQQPGPVNQLKSVKITGPEGAVKAGKSGIIKCSFRNLTANEMIWRKNKEDIDISDKSKYKGGTLSNPTLTILNLTILDQGAYQCICRDTNKRNVESNTIELKVKDLPQVYLIQPLDAAKGEDITIHCVVRASPAITSLKWEKDGVLLYTMDEDKYDGGNLDEPSLTIKNISPDDAGAYCCLCTNRKGTGRSELVNLNVVDFTHTFEEVALVETEAIKKAKETIMKEGMVVLVGDFGVGKSRALEQVFYHVFDLDTEYMWKTIGADYDCDKDVGDNAILEGRYIIRLDGYCGRYNTNPVRLKQMQGMLYKLRKLTKSQSHRRKVIATLSSTDFNLISSQELDKSVTPILDVVQKCDLSEKEKNQILEAFTEQDNCQCEKCNKVSWGSVMEILKAEQSRSSLLGLSSPLICRLVSIPYIAQNVGIFIDKPLVTLAQGFEQLKETDIALYCGLIYMMLKGGTLDERSIDHECLRHVLILHSALPEHDYNLNFSTKLVTQQLKTVPEYFKYDIEKIEFFHEIITLVLFCIFYKMYPIDTIRYCDLQIIAELFRPEDYDSSNIGGIKPLIEAFLVEERLSSEHGREKEKTADANRAEEKGSESSPHVTKDTMNNKTRETCVSVTAAETSDEDSMNSPAKENPAEKEKHGRATGMVKEQQELTGMSNETFPQVTKNPSPEKGLPQMTNVATTAEHTSSQQNTQSLQKADGGKHLSKSEVLGPQVIGSQDSTSQEMSNECSPVKQNEATDKNPPQESHVSPPASAKFSSSQQNTQILLVKNQAEVIKHEQTKGRISTAGNSEVDACTAEEMSASATTELSCDAELMSVIGDQKRKEKMMKKSKYYFTLNEENHKVFMKRILDAGKMDEFKDHPLMHEVSYTQVQ